MAMSRSNADFRPRRWWRAWWLFATIGAACGAIAFAFLGYKTGHEDWSPPLDAGDMQTFIVLTALIGVLVGAVTGLAIRVGTMRGLPLAGRIAAWGMIGGWLVLLLIFTAWFNDPAGIGGPIIYRRDVAGFWDRLVEAVLVPLLYGAWIFVALGAIVGAAAAVGWWLLFAAIHRGK